MEYIVNAAHTKAAALCGITKPKEIANAVRAAKPEAAAPRLKSGVSSSDAVLAIISAESGVPIRELTDAQHLDDLGVDSLLSLLIVSRVREELGIELGNSFFMEFSNVGALRSHIEGLALPSRVDHPDTIIDAALPQVGSIWSSVLEIVSQEAGVPMEELSDGASLADLGLDSLLSLVITSRLQDELDINLGHVSLFVECDTVGDLRALIVTGSSSQSDDDVEETTSVSASDSSSSRFSWSSSMVSPSETPFTASENTSTVDLSTNKGERPIARSLTIQGM